MTGINIPKLPALELAFCAPDVLSYDRSPSKPICTKSSSNLPSRSSISDSPWILAAMLPNAFTTASDTWWYCLRCSGFVVYANDADWTVTRENIFMISSKICGSQRDMIMQPNWSTINTFCSDGTLQNRWMKNCKILCVVFGVFFNATATWPNITTIFNDTKLDWLQCGGQCGRRRIK